MVFCGDIDSLNLITLSGRIFYYILNTNIKVVGFTEIEQERYEMGITQEVIQTSSSLRKKLQEHPGFQYETEKDKTWTEAIME